MPLLVIELILCLAANAAGEVIDRMAVTVANRVITQSDIVKEIRLGAFLNRVEPDLGAGSRKRTAERLVERVLFEIEMDLGRYAAPQAKEVEPELDSIRKGRYTTEEAFRKDLAKCRIGEDALKLYLLQQLSVLRFIDARFGPGVQILETDVQDYYNNRFVNEWRSAERDKPVPPVEEVEAQIEETLRGEQVNRLMDQWLAEARSRTRVEYKPEAFE
jgi:hypothetical protein